MTGAEDILLRRVEHLIEQESNPQNRIVIALAGAPGSGKSTIASALTEVFNASHTEQLQVVPMDGFHLTKSALSRMQSAECPFRRRGAPFTFDSERFVHLVQCLCSSLVTEVDEPDSAIWAPSFDHAIKDPVEGDIRISSSQRIVLLEGSYLLLDEDPWRVIRELVSETWFISVPREISKQRLISRHVKAGIEPDEKSAETRVETNDLLNWDLINCKLLPPGIVVENV